MDEVAGYITVQAAVGALPDVNHNVGIGVAEDEVSDVPLPGSVSTTRLTSSAGRMIGSMTHLLSHTEVADSSADEDVADFSLQVRELITLVSSLSGEDVIEVVEDPVVVAPVEDMEMTVLESSIEVPASRPRRPLGLLSDFDLARRAHDSGVDLPPFSTPLDTVDGLPVSEADEDADDKGEPDYEWVDVYTNDIADLSGFHRLDLSDEDVRQFHLDEELDDSIHEDDLLIRGDLDVLPGWFTDR